MTVIATDGTDIQPAIVSSLFVHGGERYDVIITANRKPSNYLLKAQGKADCRNNSQIAILRYTCVLCLKNIKLKLFNTKYSHHLVLKYTLRFKDNEEQTTSKLEVVFRKHQEGVREKNMKLSPFRN